MLLLKIFAAMAGAGCCWLVAFLTASRLLRDARIEARLVGTIGLAYWLAAWSFEILGLLGGFELRVIIPILVVLPTAVLVYHRATVAARVRRGWGETKAEVRQLWQELRAHRWVTAGLFLVGVHLLVRMLRSLATPAFGWDDFIYHLFRAGRWVQNGSLALEPAPDAWTYYEFFPWGGDLLWAWSMVWGAGDVLVPVTAIFLWGAVPVTGYAVVRELGKDRPAALIVAVAIAVIPSQAGQMSTAYVDNAVLAMVLGASLFLLMLLRSEGPDRSRPAALLVGVCTGLGLLVKMSFLPLALPAALIVLWCSAKTRRSRDFLAFCVGFMVAIPNLIFNWIHRGSPFYPFEIVNGLPFNEQHSWILSKYGEGATASELARAAKALVINLFPLDPFLNLGFLGLLLVVLGSIGAVQLVTTTRGRWFLLWVAVGAALTMVSFFSPRNSSMVVWWTLMMGRFLVPSLAGLFLLSSLVRPVVLRWILVPLLVAEYFFYAPRGWPVEQLVATVQVTALAGLVVLSGVMFVRWRKRPVPVWSLLTLVGGLALLAVVGVRESYRYEAYRLFASRQLLDFHGAPPAEAWPIWRRLDETGPNRVAATAGFDGLTGHNWFRGPLLGPWLQNEVLYIPVTAEGQLVSYRDREALLEAADRESWLARLREKKIDRVVAMGPANIEHRWMLDLPEIFKIEITMGNDHFLLARVDKQALALHVAGSFTQ